MQQEGMRKDIWVRCEETILAHIRPFEMCDIKMPKKDRKGPSLSLKPGTFTGFPYSSLPFKDKFGHRITFYPNYNSRKVTARPRKIMVRETIYTLE